MAQKIVTLCDVHARNDEDHEGAGWTVTLLGPGDSRPTTWEIDLCEDDGKTLRDLGVMLDAVGRVTEGPRRKVATAARKAARAASPAVTAPDHRPEAHRPVEAPRTAEGYPCPMAGCGKVPTSRSGLATHLRGFHDGMTIAKATGQPEPYACPEPGCGFTSARAQGLGAHRRAAHGTLGASASVRD
jgi:hypothetical protein